MEIKMQQNGSIKTSKSHIWGNYLDKNSQKLCIKMMKNAYMGEIFGQKDVKNDQKQS